MSIFSNLSKAEIEQLNTAPALVTILIGAADGKLDGEERSWSERLLHTRSYAAQADLQDYYLKVSESFWVTVEELLSALPADAAARGAAISERLEQLNPILAKLEHGVAYDLYKGFKGLAAETAKASGGFLRIGAISAAEHAWVGLPMLTEIETPAGVDGDLEDSGDN